MDPFNSLPPEVRTNIHLLLCCKSQVLQLCRASPAMHRQYLASERYIPRKLLARELNGDLLQDAMAIVLFPAFDAGHFEGFGSSVHRVMDLRAQQQLPDPFEQRDYATIAKLERLYDRMMMYVEDYIAKATAPFPPRAYLCLPDLSSARSKLRFRDEIVSDGFDACALGESERKRLLRAFLRYELLFKKENPVANSARARSPTFTLRRGRPRCPLYSTKRLSGWEIETIYCVQEYLESLYGAMFAQCGDAWLPTDLSSSSLGLLYPDNLLFSADAYAHDLGLSVVRGLTQRLAQFGFDLATSLISAATAGPESRLRLRRWFKDLASEYGQRLLDSTSAANLVMLIGSSVNRPEHDPPGMYQRLYPTLEEFMSCQMAVLRQRAWVFLDDARLCPDGEVHPHFPLRDERMKSGSVVDHHRQRAQRRSQKWHDQFENPGSLKPMSVDDDADRRDSRLEAGAQSAIPRFFDAAQAGQLIPFWRWDPHPDFRPGGPPFPPSGESASREASEGPHQTLRTGDGPTAQSSSSHQPTSSLLSFLFSLDSGHIYSYP